MKTVKQLFKENRDIDSLSEAMTLIFNVQEMGRKCGHIYTDGTIEAMTIEELREAQSYLIPLYNEAIKLTTKTK